MALTSFASDGSETEPVFRENGTNKLHVARLQRDAFGVDSDIVGTVQFSDQLILSSFADTLDDLLLFACSCC